MITFLVIKILDRKGTDDPGHYWYGAVFASLFDVLLLAMFIYWLRSLWAS
jgi:hypothetical protein